MNKTKEEIKKSDVEYIPICNIRMMSDDEWNRLAYQIYLERKAVQNNE